MFKDICKKSSTCRIYKKDDKQIINNYKQTSLQSICWKIFERLIFNCRFKYFEEQNLFSADQYDYRTNYSRVKQILLIVYIYIYIYIYINKIYIIYILYIYIYSLLLNFLIGQTF